MSDTDQPYGESRTTEEPREPTEELAPSNEPPRARSPLVIGIGASAGGLESLRKFFRQVPPDTGMAFVVVVHLLPDHKSLMPELLQRDSHIPVVQITDGMPLAENRVHIIPPDHKITLTEGRFHLIKAEREIPLAQIDLFFSSLAESHGQSAVAVVLSGAGSDGTQGVRVIKEHLGVAIAEKPETAHYASMPQAAIDTGLIDRILPAEDIPGFLLQLASSERPPTNIPPEDQTTEWTLRRIFLTLRSRSGHDFSGYKRNTIIRRIERRMYLHHIVSLGRYAEFLQETPEEVGGLFKDLLIGVTRFFRDPESYDVLASEVLPVILEDKPDNGTIRVWTPGAATGEEAYSIAIMLLELREQQNKNFKIQIFATDIDPDAIECARAGRYPASIAEDVSPDRLHRFFDQEGDQYRVRRAVRETVIFAEQNIIKDPPFTRLDLLTCRNLLIYLNSELQYRLLPLFHYSLRPRGFLMLGASETIGEYGNLFATVDAKWRVFRVREGSVTAGPAFDQALLSVPIYRQPAAQDRRDESSLYQLTSRILLDRYAPPAVIIDARGDVLFIHGRTGRYLEPAPGRENKNIVDMARPGLDLHLTQLIREASIRGEEMTRHGIRVKVNGDEAVVNLTVRPVKGKDPAAPLLMITFEETSSETAPSPNPESETAHDHDIQSLQSELRNTRENLQTVVEELEASNEELRSTNEEYQSTNEELNSTNEELETSREELQSLNEELGTINRDMQEKLDELTRANNEITSLLNSLEVPTVFIDNELRIRRFTKQAQDLIHLIESDIGRPLSDITYDLNDDALVEDARGVLRSMLYHQKEVRTTGGRWYLRRIVPYRSAEDTIVGVVINFVDIHALKQQTESLEDTRHLLEAANLKNLALVLLDDKFRIEAANQPFYAIIDARKEDVAGKSIFEAGRIHFDTPEFRAMAERLQTPTGAVDLIKTELAPPGLGRKHVVVYARRLVVGENNQARYLLEIDTIDG